jgi:transcription elongation factor/antiterminator RfaH
MPTLNNVTTRSAAEAFAGLPFELCHGERWYAVHSQPCAEIRAAAQLQNQGFRTFMPRRRKTVRHARQIRTVIAPLFPRYFFVALDMTRDQWRSVNGTFGVSRLVMGAEQPHPVPRGVVEALIASTDGEGFLNLAENLRPGSPVRLMTGPFAEQLAVLEELDDTGRVRVLLDILGRKVRVNTQADNLLPIA